jgi:hypothetical protein
VATSTVNVVTSGALAVDVSGSATGFDSALSTVSVESHGAADVRGAAYAYGNDTVGLGGSGADTAAILLLYAEGDIRGVSQAVGGQGVADFHGNYAGGNAGAAAYGVTTGSHAVTLTANATGGAGQNVEWFWTAGGGATAFAYGVSERGAVNVTATARGGSGDANSPYGSMVGSASASAVSITTAAGGVGKASALAVGKDVNASATSQSVSGAYTASAGGVDGNSAGAYSATVYQASAVALPDLSGSTHLVSNTVAAPSGAESAALLSSSPNVAAIADGVRGVGAQAAVSASPALSPPDEPSYKFPYSFSTSGGFEFSTAQAGHLLVGFISSAFAGAGFDTLELSISANGATVYDHTFTTLDEANAFFTDHVLDLGLFEAGDQNVLVSSYYTFVDPAAYGFNYVVGTSVSAVPEASSWMMMVFGLGGVVLMARRRRNLGSAI